MLYAATRMIYDVDDDDEKSVETEWGVVRNKKANYNKRQSGKRKLMLSSLSGG